MRQAFIVFSVALKFINMIKAGIQCTDVYNIIKEKWKKIL